MRFQPRRTEEPEINLTSLIDVVLLLVIFFMVSTSFTVDGRLRLQLPGSSAVPERQAADAVVIAITADGSYSVNDRVLAKSHFASWPSNCPTAPMKGALGCRATTSVSRVEM